MRITNRPLNRSFKQSQGLILTLLMPPLIGLAKGVDKDQTAQNGHPGFVFTSHTSEHS